EQPLGEAAAAQPEPRQPVPDAEPLTPFPPGAVAAAGVSGATPPAPGLDPLIDCMVAIDAGKPIPGALVAELLGKIATGGKTVRCVGFDADAVQWEEAGRDCGDRYSRLYLALQLADRSGPLHAAQLAALCEAAQACAGKIQATVALPDARETLQRARELDRFCAEVDVAIGINIVAPQAASFSGTKIRALAEAAGFKLEPEGVFHYRNDDRKTLFTLDNHEPAPFIPEQIKTITTTGITLLLDVPRVADGHKILDRMIDIGRHFAQALGGRLVDDNRAALSEPGIVKIKRQLNAIHATMAAHGVQPGSERALRLFS
ncbi:MAG: cell division protein ZipA C-terminal FtsZ-binding domain-containing protein, partial [Burkholderiales bacterium]